MRTKLSMPGYWMHESTGVLRPVIEAYLNNEPLSGEQIATMRAYLRQWIEAPGFIGPDVVRLRLTIPRLTTRAAIERWIDDAIEIGCDPL